MADVVSAGKALWEAAIDRSKIPSDAAAVNADIAAAGAKGEQAATASATSTLAKVQGLSRAAASTVALGAGAMFGVATKLASEGENAMAKFQAQTGATADEAKAALDSMNRLAGQNLQSFGTVSDALTQVTTNMGLTGKAAEDATNMILKFSTATGTDAVQNVGAFDDVLDSWGKTAADLPGIMDQIVASTQKYGGTVDEATGALKDMAPALRAMGMSVDDGIALLDVFRASGVDAAGATAGLNKALKNLKPGQDLNDLIAQIGAIEDPTLRSQKAIELFGKSGAKLGNAIQPGMTSLDDFKVSMQDAQGATDKAASAIEDTLPNKVKLAVDGALSQARGFATDFGPALMGAGSIASIGTSIATALKLDTALAKAWGGVASSPAYLAAARAAGAAGGAVAGAAATAATVLAPIALFATLVITLTEVLPVKEAQTAIDKAAGGRDLRSFWEKLLGINGPQRMPWDSGLKAGDQAAQGVVEGTTKGLEQYGPALPEAFRKAFGGPARGTFQDLGVDVGSSFFDGIRAASGNTSWNIVLGPFLDSPTTSLAEGVGTKTARAFVASFVTSAVKDGNLTNLSKLLDSPTTSFAEKGATSAHAFITAIVETATREGHTSLQALGPALFAHDTSFTKAGAKAADNFLTGVQDSHYAEGVSDQLTHMWSSIPTAPAKVLGLGYGDALANGLKSAKGDVAGAMADLKDALAHPLRGIHTVAKVEGALTGKELADGLASSDPYTRKTAQETQAHLLAILRQLQSQGYDIGKKGMRLLGEGITDGTGQATGPAKTANNKIAMALSDPAGFHSGGAAIGNAWAAGLSAAISSGVARAEDALRGYHGPMIGQSPPKTGPLKYIDKGGFNIGRAWALGLAGGARSVDIGSSLGLGPLQQLTGGGAVVRHEGTVRHEVTLSRDTIVAARSQGASWEDIGRMGRSANAFVSGMQMRLGVNG